MWGRKKTATKPSETDTKADETETKTKRNEKRKRKRKTLSSATVVRPPLRRRRKRLHTLVENETTRHHKPSLKPVKGTCPSIGYQRDYRPGKYLAKKSYFARISNSLTFLPFPTILREGVCLRPSQSLPLPTDTFPLFQSQTARRTATLHT